MTLRALTALVSDIRVAVRASQTYTDLARDARACEEGNGGRIGLMPR